MNWRIICSVLRNIFFHVILWAGCIGESYLLGKSEIADSNPALTFKFLINKRFLPHTLVKIAVARISNPVAGG